MLRINICLIYVAFCMLCWETKLLFLFWIVIPLWYSLHLDLEHFQELLKEIQQNARGLLELPVIFRALVFGTT